MLGPVLMVMIAAAVSAPQQLALIHLISVPRLNYSFLVPDVLGGILVTFCSLYFC